MPQHFETTHWSLLLAAQQKTSPEARAALDTLCRKYWYPLYAYARRHSKSAHDALDMVQAFFAVMLEKRYLRAADKTKGRFRSFLLTALRRFMSKERDRMSAQKRGGGKPPISLDLEDAEKRYALEPSAHCQRV